MTELKPCPFCDGNKAYIDENNPHKLICPNCADSFILSTRPQSREKTDCKIIKGDEMKTYIGTKIIQASPHSRH